MYLQCSHGFWGQYFSGWCFTHQYKNTTQFCFYSGLAATQNTKGKEKWIYEVVDCTTDARYILVLPQKSGYRAVAVVSHDPQYAALIYNFGYHAIPIDYITLGHAPASIVIKTGILDLKIGL